VYVLDTSSIQVLGSYYPTTFQALWRDFDALVDRGGIVSVEEVRDELAARNRSEHLNDWIGRNGALFHPPTEAEIGFVREIFTVRHFEQLVPQRARLEGTPVADPWVIARARITSRVVVTEESDRPNAARIPNVCRHFGVDCTDMEGLLRREGWTY
jgi:hypothetical protein